MDPHYQQEKESEGGENPPKNGTTDLPQRENQPISFKKPELLIGKRGRLPKKVAVDSQISLKFSPAPLDLTNTQETTLFSTDSATDSDTNHQQDVPVGTTKTPTLPYKEPEWSGLPDSSGKPYVLEVLKNGSIIETINISTKPYWVFGRLTNCDISMQHPTISRYHAVLQYREIPSENDPPGYYIYDLGSTHGTFVNGKNNKLKPKLYAPFKVGHMIRLGCSQRSYILTGPEDDQEEESELSVTELKQLRDQKIKERAEQARLAQLAMEEKRRREEERGVDWGMGDDADEEEDIKDNPYASTNNEELYVDDPKKALRGFFEREGLDLEYNCTEQGMGQFCCKVELPLDDDTGKPVMAEVVHKGKKKEAVVQCALEACRILDRAGILRQAHHESRKRRARDWEENDYYDSDEDTFLDRTGTIEKKREKRMKVKQPEKAETYDGLVEKEKRLSTTIADVEKKLNIARDQADANASSSSHTEEDSLDSYMKNLTNKDTVDKQAISKLKLELAELKKEHTNVTKLMNVAKPADLPAFTPTPSCSNKSKFPIFGKRKLVPVKFPARPTASQSAEQPAGNDNDEEDEEDEHTEVKSQSTEPQPSNENTESGRDEVETLPTETTASSSSSVAAPPDCFQWLIDFKPINSFHETETFKKFQQIMNTDLPQVADVHKQKLVKILKQLQRLAANEDRAHCDWKTLSAKTRKVMIWMSDLRRSGDDKLHHKVTTELCRMLAELNEMSEEKFKMVGQVKEMGQALHTISMEIDRDIKQLKSDMDTSAAGSSQDDQSQDDEKKKKKNQKRIEQRQHKAEEEKRKGYEEDARKEDYNMWVPPDDQSGDGRTKLNEKYGY